MKRVAVLMAGGRSERLWPLSRVAVPKQFLDITGSGKTMIQRTVERLSSLVSVEDTYVVTGEMYVEIVRKQLPMLPEGNIIVEPVGRDTAPCIALATAVLQERYGDAVVFVLASDHLIEQEAEFLRNLQEAAAYAEAQESLVTIGILPAYAETSYGYIQRMAESVQGAPRVFPVRRFVEKPTLDIARTYVESGDYLWNSGMFIWRLSVIAGHFARWMPEVYTGMETLRNAIREGTFDQVLPKVFCDFPRISIDYGIIEKAKDVYTVPSEFTWLDVGNWNALPDICPADAEGNVLPEGTVSQGAKGTLVYQTGKRVIALVGTEDLVVVDTQDALLVARREKLAEIKPLLAKLRESGREQVL